MMPPKKIKIAGTGDLKNGQTVKFFFEFDGEEKSGFVVKHQGELFAYLNECRHIPLSLDWVDNSFLSRDRCHIVCATHGALYDIRTGRCLDGPPVGENLLKLEIESSGDAVLVKLPLRETGGVKD